jgi:hypothetical protein
MSSRPILRSLALALVLTLLSSRVTRTRLEVQDWDCPPAPASCARPVAVVGFPLPFISDFHGLSVVGRADVVGALMGEDIFHWAPFLADVTLYLMLVLAVARTASRRRLGR